MDSFDWKSFYRLEDIYKWVKDIGTKHTTTTKVISIGKTFEGRDIVIVQINLDKSPKR